MSASLVGSEMCIRDSPSAQAALWRNSPLAAPATNTGTTTEREGHHRGPVSYTHLTLPTICSV
eukprot:4391983-Alexandrium_andersonii.AAC.1